MNRPSFFTTPTGRLLSRTGGFYIVFVLVLAQLVITPLGILVAAQIVGTNAGLPSSSLLKLALVTGGIMLLRNILLLVYVYASNHAAVSRLSKWSRGEILETGTEEERLAWKQIASLSWRYITIAFASLMLFAMPLAILYLRFALNGTTDQLIYVLIAAVVAGLSIALVEVLFVERLLTNARLILTPQEFDAQVAGITGLRILTKFQIAFFALILIAILLIAPIGYHQTILVLYEEIGSQQVLADLQTQSLIVGAFSLLLGFGLSYLMTNSISQPVRQMIVSFNKVEQGDLKQRLHITATDEIGELGIYFNRMIARLDEFQTRLETQVASRTSQLRTTVEVGRVASSILRSDELITRVVNLITDQFGYYYAAIFLVDPTGRWAELRDATGEGGRILKSQKHRLEIGGKSMVGSTIASRQARIALDVGAEPVRFENPILPHTRSEISLPLMVGERVIGALDVQSREESAFGEDDVNTLQGMANQVAIALENARLFQETQHSLDELRAANRQYVAQAWTEPGRESTGYEYVAGGAMQDSGPVNEIKVPLTLREQVIGQLSLEGDQAWTADERTLIEAVATQAALALENARLFDQSQQLALRERLTAEIIGKIWASPNVDFILQTAVRELGRALRADEATIELRSGSAQSGDVS
jgi:GAF domain-containing protein/HAMP domain-containing protein